MSEWTVRTLIKSTADWLSKRGHESGRLDAELLLGHVLELDRTGLYMHADRPVTDAERDAFRGLVQRRAEGEPVAYLTGVRGFWSLDLQVDARVLVPRPETEHVVELALRYTKQFAPRAWRIVDVGTGSGAIALALATELPQATVLATDISADALEVARENAERLGLRERVKFVQADLLEPLASRPGSVDLIVSNPPYVAEDDPALESDVRRYEPGVALFAPEAGLGTIRRLLPQAARALGPGGAFLMEFGSAQGNALRQLGREHFASAYVSKDYAGHDRVLVALSHGDAPWERAEAAEEGEAEAQRAEAKGEGEGSGDEIATLPDPEGGWASMSAAERSLLEAQQAGLPIIDLDAE